MCAMVMACGGGEENDFPVATSGAVIIATIDRSTPVPTATPDVAATLVGFIFPIVGGCLPAGDQLMPNAPREYRLGTHEGVDFYNVDNCTPIGLGTPVVAPKQGRVIRVDHDYVSPTPAEMSELLANPDNEIALDAFRGQQVWVDHGNGVVTRYCHLSGIASELREGDVVAQGTVLGFVGESGTPESLVTPGTQYHLHWEVRIGDSYLGAGMESGEVRALYAALFGQ